MSNRESSSHSMNFLTGSCDQPEWWDEAGGKISYSACAACCFPELHKPFDYLFEIRRQHEQYFNHTVGGYRRETDTMHIDNLIHCLKLFTWLIFSVNINTCNTFWICFSVLKSWFAFQANLFLLSQLPNKVSKTPQGWLWKTFVGSQAKTCFFQQKRKKSIQRT